MDILLIYPPQAKPAEPPAGIPLLTATLRAHGCSCNICDLNLEGLYYLLDTANPAEDTWSRRAHKNRFRQLDSLKRQETYNSPDTYRRSVADLNRVVENCGKTKNIILSLANYQDPALSPLKSADLLLAADQFQENLYYPFFANRLEELILQAPPRYIGLSLNYLSQALCTFAIVGFLNSRFPTIPIILGGGLVTTWLQSPAWQNPFNSLVDHLVSGPGEEPLVKILTDDNKIVRRCPDYTDLVGYEYLSPGLILPYAASTGCFWRKCSFCPETSERNPYRQVAIETAKSELVTLTKRLHPSLIHFLDNAISPAMLQAQAQAGLTTPWYGFVRFTEHLADIEFCQKLRRSGCVMLKLGLESGSQNVLDGMGKGINLQLAARALDALQQAGIMTYVYLLFGTPHETGASARETMDFITRHHRQIGFLNLAIFNLPTGSPQIEELEISDFYEGDLSIYRNFNHPLGWNRKEIRRFLDNDFKREPVIQQILQRDPVHFTSNHAPFFAPLLHSG